MRARSACGMALALAACGPRDAPPPTPRPTAPPHVGRHASLALVPEFRLEGFRAMHELLGGERREAHWMTYQTAGVSTELVWLQDDPRLGPLAISYHEGAEPEKLLERLMASGEPHARWLLGQLAAVHGIREAPRPGELLLDRTIEDSGEVRARYAHAYPIPSEEIEERLERLRWVAREIEGPRLSAYEASRRRMGVAREIAWLQRDLTGNYAIYYFELIDVGRLLEQLASSDEPFDNWYGEMFEQIYDVERTGQAAKANESVVD